MPRTWLAVSASRTETAQLLAQGPRRDFAELAEAVDGTVVFRADNASRKGWRAKLFGAHVRQAWDLARRIRAGDTVFADGEHNGIPLVLFLALRRRDPAKVVVLGHLVSRRWKLAALRVVTRLGVQGTLVVHSAVQAEAARSVVGARWKVVLVPYQVDTEYWQAPTEMPNAEADDRPLVVAVGSENRDYETLVAAVEGLPLRVVIAAGSHWARETARTSTLPANVTYLDRPLRFADLRELYSQAAVVAVPVHDVSNQSGVTVILEAMSMSLPVVVTASVGQRECITGPLMRASGEFDVGATADRGPGVFAPGAAAEITGWYVPPADPGALRAALAALTADPATRDQMGREGRVAALKHFSIEQYVENLRREIAGERPARPAGAVVPR